MMNKKARTGAVSEGRERELGEWVFRLATGLLEGSEDKEEFG